MGGAFVEPPRGRGARCSGHRHGCPLPGYASAPNWYPFSPPPTLQNLRAYFITASGAQQAGVNRAVYIRRWGRREETPHNQPSKSTSVTFMESNSLGSSNGSHVRVARP